MEEENKIITFVAKEARLSKITNSKEVELCREQNIRAKKLFDWAENMRLEATREIMAAKKKIDDLWKTREKPLLDIIENNKGLMIDYLAEQEKKIAKEIKKDGFNKKDSQELAKIEMKEKSEISYRKDYEIEIMNINQVPDKYLIKEINVGEVKNAIKEGAAKIPGLRWKEIKIIINK